ncbi:hypothetical protein DEJ44_31755 [Streptomyces venezuelae]|nr:hypothetical protein DEJ44_31755 [Streptomyces venezuelae]
MSAFGSGVATSSVRDTSTAVPAPTPGRVVVCPASSTMPPRDTIGSGPWPSLTVPSASFMGTASFTTGCRSGTGRG